MRDFAIWYFDVGYLIWSLVCFMLGGVVYRRTAHKGDMAVAVAAIVGAIIIAAINLGLLWVLRSS